MYTLLHITGKDSPGLLFYLLGILSSYSLEIVDIQQRTTLSQLSLSLLLKTSSDLLFLKELNEFAKFHGLHIEVSFPDASYQKEKSYYSFTLLREPITLSSLRILTQVFLKYGVNIERIERLSLSGFTSLEFLLSFPRHRKKSFPFFRRDLFSLSSDYNIDIALEPYEYRRKMKRLLLMDMDSTLIQEEVIDELAKEAGKEKEVKEITYRAMKGDYTFKKALIERVSLLKGLPYERLEKVLRRLHLMEGAEEMVRILKDFGIRIALVSGGFQYFVDYFKKKLSLDYAFANLLEVEDGYLTGRIVGEIIDGRRKREILEELAQKEKIPLSQTVAIGDGANDIQMLERAGLGIAFNAKPVVEKKASGLLRRKNLKPILYLLGIPEKEWTSC